VIDILLSSSMKEREREEKEIIQIKFIMENGRIDEDSA
jgi:hypothetical protein